MGDLSLDCTAACRIIYWSSHDRYLVKVVVAGVGSSQFGSRVSLSIMW